MPHPAFDLAYIRAFATKIEATTNPDVVTFINALEVQLNEDNANNSFGVPYIGATFQNPVPLANFAEFSREQQIAADAAAHAEGAESPPPENTGTSTETGTSTATGATSEPTDAWPVDENGDPVQPETRHGKHRR